MSERKNENSLEGAVLPALVGGGVAALLGFAYYTMKTISIKTDEASNQQRTTLQATQEQLQGLAEELRALREQNQKLVSEKSKAERLLTITESTNFQPEKKHLTTSEIETIRAIFEMFDESNRGEIDVKNIRDLHRKLGEPLTDEEAESVIRELDESGEGRVDFDKFLSWWQQTTQGSKKGDRYTARFQFIHAKLQQEDFDTNRIVATASGEPSSLEYRIFFKYKTKGGKLKQISPWHDIPLFNLGSQSDARIFNFICEIPKWTRAKYEIATGEPYNPIKQDVRNGKPRFYKHGDMMFNYGAFPQTWEDPKYIPDDTKYPGDNDPIDVIEIGTRQLRTGQVTQVKVLGVLALIDSGETDWKVIAISINDPLANSLKDIDDVDMHIPGAIEAIRQYLRVYKVCVGKRENAYALRGECMHRDYAVQVIVDCHKHWKELRERGAKEV